MKLTICTNIYALPLSYELQVIKNGKPVIMKMEPLTMKLLAFLANKKGAVCTNQELIDDIWEGNQAVGKPALRKNIYKLRSVLSKLGESDLISTIPKKGYRLNVTDSMRQNQFSKQTKRYYVIGMIVMLLVILKIIFPGIIHRLLH